MQHFATRAFFALIGVYDFGLGFAFLIAGPAIYRRLSIEPPNHWGYVQFAACLLLIFGLMFFSVAWKPVANRNLIPYGVLLKASYCGVVLWHQLRGPSLPDVWLWFCGIDGLMGVGMLAAWWSLGREAGKAAG